jgi:hypothetical protein
MRYVYAAYMYYREGDGTISQNKYIRAVMEDGHDAMILAAPFFALQDYLAAGNEIAPSPQPEIMQSNLDAIPQAKQTTSS